MTIGEKIKHLRLERKLSQEKLAEELNVSRSAVAKWEADGGIPDIDNLIRLSSVFEVSIDELVGNEKAQNIELNEDIIHRKNHEFGNELYDIEIAGAWNDGVYDVYIVAEDTNFLYYYRSPKSAKSIYGMVNRKYITSVSRVEKKKANKLDTVEVNREYFIGKSVQIDFAKEGLIKGFFDFRDDDYRDVVIQSFEPDKLYLEYGKSINIDDITKIEER